jgi:hypothetical protein
MGRYGPPVYTEDRSGELLAQALTSAAENFVSMHRQKNQDRIAADERTRQHGRQDVSDAVTLDQAGYGRGTAPGDDLASHVSPPATSNAPDHLSFDPSGLADAMRGPVPQSSLTSPVGGQPSQSTAARPQQAPPAAHPGAFNPMTGTFGTPAPAQPRYQQITPNLYRDEERTPDARAERRTLSTFQAEHGFAAALASVDRDRKIRGYVAAGIPEERAALYVDNPGLAENDATIGRRVPPVRDPVADHAANRLFDVNHPLPTKDGSTSQPSESERKASGLLEQMLPAAEIVRNYKPELNALESKLPGALGRFATRNKPEVQKALQAGKQLVRSYMYTVSGATVTEKEAEEAAQVFLPQPGDSDQLITQKHAAMDNMIATVRRMAGRANSQVTGGPATVTRSANDKGGDIDLGATAPAAGPGKKVTVNGKTFILPD